MTAPLFVIGIDLGTTNSVVSYARIEDFVDSGTPPEIQVFAIPQLVSAGVVETRPILPSFVFLPGAADVPEGGMRLPWEPENRIAVGEFARDRGAELPQRLIASSKSWLCNPMVDRNRPILPWEGGDDVPKKSPVEASADILNHIRNAWKQEMAENEETRRMENQEIFLTVPASFDAVARELTVAAARMAGLERVTLLEEPQAAFYAWIDSHPDRWREHVQGGDLVLVCDVGGGTSDFSLIQVADREGDLDLERIAVGDHLLVGGDNMDLALAHAAAARLRSGGSRMDAWQIRGLWHACRKAKEALLSGAEIHSYPVTLLGRGSSLIGGSLRFDLSDSQVHELILDGFFPRCPPEDRPRAEKGRSSRDWGWLMRRTRP